METLIRRALEVIDQTGDRFVVYDQATGRAYVMLSFDAYEALLSKNGQKSLNVANIASQGGGLTNGDLLDKINADLQSSAFEQKEMAASVAQGQGEFLLEPVE